jgi:hypothetical protein
MAFEMLGENLLKVIKKYGYRGMPLSIVRDFSRQICVGMDFLHRHCQIIHTDLKPENILIATRGADPDINLVKSIIGDKQPGTGKSSKSKKGKGSSAASTGDAGTQKVAGDSAALDATLLGDGEKPLSAEQKKKLKKKLKKKRQLARKNEDKKKQRNGRRKARGGGGDTVKRHVESSVEKAKLEMMMMERASIPSSMLTHSEGRAEHLEGDEFADEDAADVDLPFDGLSLAAGGKSTSSGSFLSKGEGGHKAGGGHKEGGVRYAKDGDDEKHHANESDLHVQDLEYDADCKLSHHGGGGATGGRFNARDLVKQSMRAEYERVYNALPMWARPTVFTYLNFDLLSGVDTSECADFPGRPDRDPVRTRGAELYYGSATQLLPEDFRVASKLMQARITMVRSIS